MFEIPYLKVLESLLKSFKEHKISELIKTINDKLLAALKSSKFNPRIAEYLTDMNAEGVPFSNFTENPDNISQIKKLINALYHARRAFLDLESIDIRNVRKTLPNLVLVWNNTVREAYQASNLLTHLDVDLRGIFSDESALLLPAIAQFNSFSEDVSAHTQMISETLKQYPLSYQAGLVCGVAVDQMQPQSSDLDYNFLAQFGAVLPSYLERFTQFIDKHSSGIIAKESMLNKVKIQELQDVASKLLFNLDDLKANNLFLPLQILNYVHIIRNVITLSMSILEQIGNVSESSQDVIRDKLALLKYTVLPTLFGLVDKIEDNALLSPGTLSRPLMAQIRPLYQWLIHYASSPVDFYAKGEELLSIEDSRFITLRLERTYKRIDEARKSFFKIRQTKNAFNEFFELLNDYQNYSISSLPLEIKKKLISHYKLLKPYMSKVNVDLNNTLIDSLNSPTSSWSLPSLRRAADHVSAIQEVKEALQQLITKDKNSQLFHINLNEDLINSVHKNAELALFPYNGSDLLVVNEQSVLEPTHRKVNPLKFVEKNGGNCLVPEKENLAHLNSEQALDLAQLYRNKQLKLQVARDEYVKFIEIINNAKKKSENKNRALHRLNPAQLQECRNSYNVFQPYFIAAVPAELKNEALEFDKYLVDLFSGKKITRPKRKQSFFEFLASIFTSNDAPKDMFGVLDEYFQNHLSKIIDGWMTKNRFYTRLAENKYRSETDESPLQKETPVEALLASNTISSKIISGLNGWVNYFTQSQHQLIGHNQFSQFTAVFRTSLFKLTEFFNQSMKKQLKAKESGLPFPELEDLNPTLEQPEQVIALKRIFNSLYHIEGIAIELEKLNNKHTESRYVYHLLCAYGHINEIVKSTKALISDPHFKLIGREIFEKAQTLLTVIEEHTAAYKIAPEKAGKGEKVQYNSLWYVLNAFTVLPKHIRTIRNNNYTTTAQLNELHRQAKKATVRIEKIINSSHSYFKLFLQTPNMYKLYSDLINKLNEFNSTSHDAVLNNLDQIRTGVFLPMLLEADHWETQLGFQPGTLSGPLKEVTDEYFKGLLNPLGLKSKTHINLICDNTTLEQRKDKAREQIKKEQSSLIEIEENYQFFCTLHRLMGNYLAMDVDFQDVKPIEQELLAEYRKARPKLVELDKIFNLEPDTDENMEHLDDLLNASIEECYDERTHIMEQVKSASSYYKGLRATHEMKISTANEQLAYLTQLGENQVKEDLRFIEEYTESAFHKQMDAFFSAQPGLYTCKEFQEDLKAFLLGSKNSIIQQSKNSEDIKQSISRLLTRQIKIFEKNNLTQYYQLETVRTALTAFHVYIKNNNSVFENEDSLEKKSVLIGGLTVAADRGALTIAEHIKQISDSARDPEEKNALLKDLNQLTHSQHTTFEMLIIRVRNGRKTAAEKKKEMTQLKELAKKVTLSVEERIEYIKTKVAAAEFKDTILEQHQPNFFSVAFLEKCLLSLLEALYLFTPTNKKQLNNMTIAMINPPKISELANRYGLFANNAVPEVRDYALAPLPAPLAVQS